MKITRYLIAAAAPAPAPTPVPAAQHQHQYRCHQHHQQHQHYQQQKYQHHQQYQHQHQHELHSAVMLLPINRMNEQQPCNGTVLLCLTLVTASQLRGSGLFLKQKSWKKNDGSNKRPEKLSRHISHEVCLNCHQSESDGTSPVSHQYIKSRDEEQTNTWPNKISASISNRNSGSNSANTIPGIGNTTNINPIGAFETSLSLDGWECCPNLQD